VAVSEVSAIILAGGNSTRMGQDKATLPWGDSDILHCLVAALQGSCQEIIVVSNCPRKLPTSVRIVADIIPGQGPLSGIHAGLYHSSYPHAVIIGCDMPFIVPEFVRLLVDKSPGWDAVVPIHNQKLEPLLAVYGKPCLPVIEKLLVDGDCRVSSLLATVRCLQLPEAEWRSIVASDNVFRNLNTYKDYQSASTMRGVGNV
jgi:molybdopterin-guanine dinucleotide biosynthesis protein A